MSKILKSDSLTSEIYDSIKYKLKSSGKKPGLAIIVVGDRSDSNLYIKMKRKKCSELGIESYLYAYLKKVSPEYIIKSIESLNNSPGITGIIVQLPLPSDFSKDDEYNILNSVSPEKDVDGFHRENIGKLMLNVPSMTPCTAEGCFRLLEHHNIDIVGKHIVIVGSSKVVGLPLSMILLHNGATTTLCNVHTENIKNITKNADILISCCGSPCLIDNSWIKEDTTIIDVGINSTERGIVGDVNYDDVYTKVKHITPVPGCIGPLTIAILMEHLVNCKQ